MKQKTTYIPKKRAINNILKIYKEASEEEHENGFWWYVDAHRWAQEVADRFHLPLPKVCGITASLSPGCSWEVNKVDTVSLIRFVLGETSHLSVSTYGQFVNKARSIYEGEDIPKILNGPKITAFYFNMLNPWDKGHVCIDRHAFKIARRRSKGGSTRITPRQMSETQDAYKELASQLGLRPNQLQAITWVTYKRIHGR